LPDTKVYLATHSVLSYNIVGISGITSGVMGITTGTNQYLATGLYDGIIGQTWSDTAGAVLTQNGMTYQNRFLAGYLGYASYVDSVGDLDLFTGHLALIELEVVEIGVVRLDALKKQVARFLQERINGEIQIIDGRIQRSLEGVSLDIIYRVGGLDFIRRGRGGHLVKECCEEVRVVHADR
jgi:hypothetical protein